VSSERLFHLAPVPAVHAALASCDQLLKPRSLSTQGFVHLSFGPQLPGTLAVHCASFSELILLEADPFKLGPELRLEPSREGALFPHLYGALPMEALPRAWWMQRSSSGWPLPELGPTPTEDSPGGLPLSRLP